MINWIARAAAFFHGDAHATHRQNPRNKVSEVSAAGGETVLAKNVVPTDEPANDPADVRTRWLLHFADRDDLAVTFSPPVTRDEALRQYPDALAAIPVPDPPPAPSGCSTCRHRTAFDNCGEPVRTGLAEVFQLAKHPAGGEACAVFERKPITADDRVEALLAAGLLDQDDANLARQRYADDPDQWDQLLDALEREGLKG